MPRLANVSEGQISKDECPALEAFMLSLCHGYLCIVAIESLEHIKKALTSERNRKWKIVGVNPFSMENAWCSVVIVSLWTATQMSTASQETSKIAQMDLCYNEQTKTRLLASATLQKPGQNC